jgi:small-conductance mechanosensitive channel
MPSPSILRANIETVAPPHFRPANTCLTPRIQAHQMLQNFHHLRHGWFLAIFLFCAAMVLSNAVHWILFRILRRKEQQGTTPGWGIQRHLGGPSRAVFMITCLLFVIPIIPGLSADVLATIRHAVVMVLVCAIGWFLVGCVYVLQTFMLRKYDLKATDNLHARRVHTQFQVFRHLLVGFVVIITIGALLWTSNDPRIWHYGSGLLASAGIASLLLASAAKSTVSNLLAGIQIAFTEPIRIDDVVVIKGEWGRIEEITSAYVVVNIWDLRRLIVPLSYFIENPIENWTRVSSQILGSSFLYVDFSVPIKELREELTRVVHADPNWDGQVLGLQVTNLSEKTMELRCLMSSSDSSKSFDLRCNVREAMIAYIQQHYPEALPTMRIHDLPQLAPANPHPTPQT